MSDSSPSPSPTFTQNETRRSYVMLPNTHTSSQPPKPVQVIQGPDGLLYAFTPPAPPSVPDNPIGSMFSRLSQAGTAAILPQGLNFASPTALAAATAVAAGGQINIGALAAAAAFQGQNPTPGFPFLPIYTPFSVPSPLSQGAASAAVTLQPLPVNLSGAGAQLQPKSHSQQHEASPHKSSGSIQCLLAPSEAKMKRDGQTEHSRPTSSTSSDCQSPSPTLPKAMTQLSTGSWGTDVNTSITSLSKELPVLISSSVPAVDMTQKAATPQDRTVTNNVQLIPSADKVPAVASETISSFSSPAGLHNVHSLSSLSRYVNPIAVQKPSAPTSSNTSSLEKLLKPHHEAKETRDTTYTPLQDASAEQKHSLSILLVGEPHLMQFYDLFCKSQLSEHLRIRILAGEGGASVLKWIEVTRSASHIEPNLGPLDAARILISSNGLCKLQLMFPYTKTLSTRFVPTTMAQANELFSELSPKHVVCPGLPDCEEKLTSLGYQPTNVRVVETPGMKRYDHEKCPIWHIPLPCNLYSESGQIVHHMCKQCKNLLNTLNKTITKIAGLNITTALRNQELSQSDLASLSVGAPLPSLSSPPYLNRSHSNKVAAGQESSREGHGRRRKRKMQSKQEEGPGKKKKTM